MGITLLSSSSATLEVQALSESRNKRVCIQQRIQLLTDRITNIAAHTDTELIALVERREDVVHQQDTTAMALITNEGKTELMAQLLERKIQLDAEYTEMTNCIQARSAKLLTLLLRSIAQKKRFRDLEEAIYGQAVTTP